jgi:hypothetical protein
MDSLVIGKIHTYGMKPNIMWRDGAEAVLVRFNLLDRQCLRQRLYPAVVVEIIWTAGMLKSTAALKPIPIAKRGIAQCDRFTLQPVGPGNEPSDAAPV